MTTPKRWTKRAIRELRQQLDSFVLAYERYVPSERIRAVLDAHRADIVTGGLRSFRSLLADRAKQDREGAEHARTSGVWGRSTEEMVARFETSAAEEEKSVAYIDALLARVASEGLPPDLASYVPARLGGA